MKTTLKLVVLFYLCFLTASIPVDAVNVQPMSLNVKVRPGETSSFSFNLTTTDTQKTVDLQLYQPIQSATGDVSFSLSEGHLESPAEWIILENKQVVVPPDASTTVNGTIQVPYNTAGSHSIVIMVQPQVDSVESGLQFLVRYAIQLNITVESPGIWPYAEVVHWDIIADDNRQPLVKATFKNPSLLRYPVSMEMTIRGQNRRLIERSTLRTPSNMQAKRESTTIYPGAKVDFIGPITKYLAPGDYELRLFVRYADGRQRIESKKLSLAGDEFDQSDRVSILKIEPEAINIALRPGAAISQILQIENHFTKTMQVVIGGEEISEGYTHCVYKAIDIQFRGEQQFELASQRNGRNVLTFRTDRSLEPGGYYGNLIVYALSTDGELVHSYPIPLRVLVGDGWTYTADVQSIKYVADDNSSLLFSLVVRNTSPAHITPSGVMYIKDLEGVIKRTVPLHIQDGVSAILPSTSGYLAGNTRTLDIGKYVAEIHLTHDSKNIATATLPFEIDSTKIK